MKQVSVSPKAIILFALFSSSNDSGQVVADFSADKTVGVTPMFVQFTNLSTYPDDRIPSFSETSAMGS